MLSRSQNPVDVFVVGGGPAGLATAIAARRRGLSVIVADGAIPPIDKPCGEGLMPDGLAGLHELGVEIPADEVYPFRGIRFVSSGKEAIDCRGVTLGCRHFRRQSRAEDGVICRCGRASPMSSAGTV